MTVCNMTIEGGGRAGHDRARRDDVRVGRRSPAAARTRCLDEWRALQHRRRRRVRPRDRRRRRRAQPDGHLGHDARGWSCRSPRRCPSRRRAGRARARVHGPGARHADPGDQARPRVHRLVHELADRRPARRRRGRRRPQGRQATSTRWSCRARSRSRRRPSARASTRSSSAAGFDWRGAGCSMCLGMNPDIAAPGERVASTSNRNFEGRQGRGARSHLVSPQMAAAAAIEGHFVDIRNWEARSRHESDRDDHRPRVRC